MSNKYNETQEKELLNLLTLNLTFEELKKALADLTTTSKEFKGLTARELLSKSQHLAKTIKEVDGKPTIYNKKEYKTKQGVPTVRKAAMVQQLAKLLEVNESDIQDLESCTKKTLELLISKLTD